MGMFARARTVRAGRMGAWGAFHGAGPRSRGLGETLPALDLNTGELDYSGVDNVSYYTEEQGETVEGEIASDADFDSYIAEQSAASEESRIAEAYEPMYSPGNAPYGGSGNRISQTSPARGGSAGYNSTGSSSDFGKGVADFFGSIFKGIVGVAEGAVKPREPVPQIQQATPPWLWWVVGGVGAVAVVGVVVAVASGKKSE